jgi:hypothetical protein
MDAASASRLSPGFMPELRKKMQRSSRANFDVHQYTDLIVALPSWQGKTPLDVATDEKCKAELKRIISLNNQVSMSCLA